jgi:small-conductance mechanosensitive channel
MDMATVDTFLRTTVADLAVKVVAAIVFWFVGRWLISRVIHLVQATMHRNQIDPTLTRYLGSIITVALNIALVLGILGYFDRRNAGRRRRGDRRGLERHAGQFRGRRVHAGAATVQGG